MPNYASQDLDYITHILHIQTDLPPKADMAIIFGTRYPDPVPLAAELYHSGRVPLIVATGGINRGTGLNEAQAHAELLRAAGVPDHAILIEDQSTNTKENVTFALPLITQKLPLANVQSVIAVCKWFHARRVLMTLKATLPPGIRYYAHTYAPQDIRPDNWQLSEASRAAVMKNWLGIPKYLAMGHIAEIEVSEGGVI